jgi:hypothetical protein
VEQRDEVRELTRRDSVLLRITGAVAVAQSRVATDGLRVRLSEADGRIVVQANARAAGRPIRVQTAAATLDEAADDLAERLGCRILEAAACWSPRPWPDSDDVSVPSRVPPGRRARGLGLLARIKPVLPAACPPEVAAAVMDLMDYPAHLFIDADTGLAAVVHRAGPTGYRLSRSRAAPPPAPNVIPLTVNPLPAAKVDVERAITSLEDTGLNHLFFSDPETGRAQLLYRRFDSRYALLQDARPASASAGQPSLNGERR